MDEVFQGAQVTHVHMHDRVVLALQCFLSGPENIQSIKVVHGYNQKENSHCLQGWRCSLVVEYLLFIGWISEFTPQH